MSTKRLILVRAACIISAMMVLAHPNKGSAREDCHDWDFADNYGPPPNVHCPEWDAPSICDLVGQGMDVPSHCLSYASYFVCDAQGPGGGSLPSDTRYCVYGDDELQ